MVLVIRVNRSLFINRLWSGSYSTFWRAAGSACDPSQTICTDFVNFLRLQFSKRGLSLMEVLSLRAPSHISILMGVLREWLLSAENCWEISKRGL
jgi:hypothetical protein